MSPGIRATLRRGLVARILGKTGLRVLLAASLSAGIALCAGTANAGPKKHPRALQATSAVSPLTVTVTDEPDPVRLTNEVRYFITVTNDGTENANFVTLDSNTDIPATMPVTAVQTSLGTCSYNSTTYNVHCDLGTMPPGTRIRITIVSDARVVGTVGAPRVAQRTVTVTPANGPRQASWRRRISSARGRISQSRASGRSRATACMRSRSRSGTSGRTSRPVRRSISISHPAGHACRPAARSSSRRCRAAWR